MDLTIYRTNKLLIEFTFFIKHKSFSIYVIVGEDAIGVDLDSNKGNCFTPVQRYFSSTDHRGENADNFYFGKWHRRIFYLFLQMNEFLALIMGSIH